jgi:predicted phosphodiesterase
MNIKDIIISDLHLGSYHCNRKHILKILDFKFEQLIVNGDVISCQDSNNLNSVDFEILERLEHLQGQNKCFVTRGNHELYYNQKKCTSLYFQDSYTWFRYGKKLKAVHGHRTNLLKIWKPLDKRVIELAREEDCRVVFAGHNHSPEVKKENGIIYVNTGAFVNYMSHYAVVYDNQTIRLCSLKPEYRVYKFPKLQKPIIDVELENEYPWLDNRE